MFGADYITGWVDPAGNGAIILDTIASASVKEIPVDDRSGILFPSQLQRLASARRAPQM